ncbi:hypothetical protein HZA97_09100 [Candidatus Woesearchaeota archaeon]|nr:hypothetical protein [Candidatus Woesearchaeota archaeon]
MSEYVYVQKNYFLSGVGLSGAVMGVFCGGLELLNSHRDKNKRLTGGVSQFLGEESPSAAEYLAKYLDGKIIKNLFELLVEQYGPEFDKAAKNKNIAVLSYRTEGCSEFDEHAGKLVAVRASLDVKLSESELETMDTLMKGIQFERWTPEQGFSRGN